MNRTGNRIKRLALPLAAIAILFGLPAAAEAQIVVDIQQSGSNLVVTSGGSISLQGLTSQGDSTLGSQGLFAYNGYLSGGTYVNGQPDSVRPLVTAYSGFTGPLSFGSGGNYANSSSGDDFAFSGSAGLLYLAASYVSGSIFSSSETFNNTTLASFGLQDGSQYVYTGSNGQTVTINSGKVVMPPLVGGAVPEPATWAMMIGGFGLVGTALRRRRATARAGIARASSTGGRSGRRFREQPAVLA